MATNDDIVIRAEGLGKKYTIGHTAERQRYVALRDVMARGVRNLQRSAMDLIRGRPMVVGDEVEEFWALRDVNFEIKRGEVVGVIGRNGAGKSTLLKILSRITEPSEGRASIHGRVASLLEVGTGFHPELTGRENIYLNGAILGMSRAEIKAKFDEIVAFAEVEKFLDTPVKRYSSGMYVRLAFAVAAHLEPEILVVDEVLAVGDGAFQQKCLGKMGEIAGKGRTILFVSHNMSTIQALCDSAILLSHGRILLNGDTADVIRKYIDGAQSIGSLRDITSLIENLPHDPIFRLRRFDVLQDEQSTLNVLSGKPVDILFDYDILGEVRDLIITFLLYDTDGSLLFESFHNGDSEISPLTHPGRYVSCCRIPSDFLAPRTYELRINAAIHRVRDCIPQPSEINLRLNVTGTGRVNSAYPGYNTPGRLAPLLRWDTVVTVSK